MPLHGPQHARRQQDHRAPLQRARHALRVGEAVQQREQGLRQDQLARQGDGHPARRQIPQVVADHGSAQRQQQAHEPEAGPVARRSAIGAARRLQRQHHGAHDQRDDAAGQAIQHGPLRGADMRMALEETGIVERIPGPARERADGAQHARQLVRHAGAVRTRAVRMAEDIDIDAGDARSHHQQRQGQAAQGRRAVVLVAEQRHAQGQQTDDQRRGRHAGQLDAIRQQQVIHDIAGQRLAQHGQPVAAPQPAQQGQEARQHQAGRQRAVTEVAAHHQLGRRKIRQQDGHNENGAPEGAGQQTRYDPTPHAATLTSLFKDASIGYAARVARRQPFAFLCPGMKCSRTALASKSGGSKPCPSRKLLKARRSNRSPSASSVSARSCRMRV
ncbi:hypothetical protein JAB9_30090 [Janthinobacterium sp. HH107]|nr:hypothetical protein JAB9_30090 [Janthinobacterium sp. HH107]